ncbi:MAG: helix-turn-helix transcriptional regulator [Faecousia sp.]
MNYDSICSTLRQLRENAGYTPEALARFFGMDGSLIRNWESGVSEPTITECLVLSKLYGISLDNMFADFSVQSLIPEDCAELFERKLLGK